MNSSYERRSPDGDGQQALAALDAEGRFARRPEASPPSVSAKACDVKRRDGSEPSDAHPISFEHARAIARAPLPTFHIYGRSVRWAGAGVFDHRTPGRHGQERDECNVSYPED